MEFLLLAAARRPARDLALAGRISAERRVVSSIDPEIEQFHYLSVTLSRVPFVWRLVSIDLDEADLYQ